MNISNFRCQITHAYLIQHSNSLYRRKNEVSVLKVEWLIGFFLSQNHIDA